MKIWSRLTQEEMDAKKNLQVIYEEELIEMGVSKYWKEFNRAPDESEPEQQLLDASVIHLQPVFQDWLDSICQKRTLPSWCTALVSIGSAKAADIVIRNVIRTTLEGSPTVGLSDNGVRSDPKAQVLAQNIADDVLNIVSYQISKEQYKEDWRKQSKFTKNWSPKRCKAFTKRVNQLPNMTTKNKQDFGHAMIRVALLSDILIAERTRKKKGRGLRDNLYIRFNDDILKELNNKHHLLELSALIYRPMVALPLDHLPDEPGGNYLRWLRKPTVKRYVNHNRNSSNVIKNHASDEVLRGLNGLQKTEWSINHPVKEVMTNLFHNNTGIANLPNFEFEGFQMRPYPEEGDKIEQAKWMEERTELWSSWYRDEQKRARMLVRLHIANSLPSFFYHAWCLDFRSRAYTNCELLSPQGSDFDKGLIYFANPVKQTERGLYWLKVHTANLFDQDDLMYDDRVKWVDDNWDMLMAIAEDPYSNQQWVSDKIKKNPSFQRLAACFELARKDGMTQLPIQRDGKCNGSQHWSVIMGDTNIAKLTNVIASDKPQDLYEYIAQATTDIVNKNDDNIDWLDTFASHWCNGIDRGVVKRPTMCDAYGLTFYGIQKYIRYEGHLDWISRDDRGGAVVELARAIKQGLGNALTKPNLGKEWLRLAASKASEKDTHLIWKTPSGFIVEHVYQPIRQRRSYTELYNKKKFELVFSTYDDGVNADGQSLGISPNFIHSLDAAHMFITINLLLDAGIVDMSMIHDSYGCHAPFIDVMDKLIRIGFVLTHKDNVLEKFREDIREYCGVELPLPPNKAGEHERLDPEVVMESEYFFT